ncbi:hypothetical protein JNB_19173 [Janibacter sp. HTCC2649]|uniref:hypothetical protein n=1 Tax=Janibacter sp. HTCC2649 TaxID=313589 RepID=UPI0000671001|nr:hypothetical protein [Janibacter sp. HTCC2649]EAP97623.1 hypothetical protein JNB_19173 [Janibacter sp. HTCC2649]
MTTQLNPDGPVILASSIALALFGGIWLLFAVPLARGAIAGLTAGNWWRPFEPNARGRYGPVAGSRFFASFRAPEPERRTRAGLLIRWGIWVVVLIGLGYYPATLVVRLIEISRTT